MFQSVTYTGFEKHPERRAWVVGVVMPIVEETFRKESGPLRVRWHDPDVEVATPDELLATVRREVAPDLADAPLVGRIAARDPDYWGRLNFPGILLVVVSDRISSGWAYLPLPGDSEDSKVGGLGWAIRSLYLKMLSDVMDRRQVMYREDPVTAGES